MNSKIVLDLRSKQGNSINLMQDEIDERLAEENEAKLNDVKAGEEVKQLLSYAKFIRVKKVLDKEPEAVNIVDNGDRYMITLIRNVTSEVLTIGEVEHTQYTYEVLETNKPKTEGMTEEILKDKLTTYAADIFKFNEDNDYLLYKVDESSMDLYSMCIGLMQQNKALSDRVTALETPAPTMVKAKGEKVELVSPTVSKLIKDGE